MTTAAAAPTPTSPIEPIHPIKNPAPPPRRRTFAAFAVPNFRVYAAGQSVANTGNWMQSIAQDWLVLQLTGSPAAVGFTMALQFLPMLLLGMHGGMLADRYPKRLILAVTQSLNLALTSTLAVLTLTGQVQVGHVYLLALAGGLVFVVDNPTRQVFVNEVVPARYVPNAIALNAAVFQTSRLLGPAVAAVLIGTVGIGWAFAANALCYAGPLVGLMLIKGADLVRTPPAPRAPHQLRSALRYVADRPDVAWTIVLVGVVGTFGLKFPVVLTAMADTAFAGGADLYGLFNVVLAVGSVVGALLAGGRTRSHTGLIVVMAAAFSIVQITAGWAPGVPLFLVALVLMGTTNLAFQAMANSAVQTAVAPAMRGRVMGLYMLAFTGGTPIGAPIIGWITATYGPRIGMTFCGVVPLLAAVSIVLLNRRRRRRATVDNDVAAV
ncbi:MFS transporter [Actinomycetes bacterium KLBMP 9759]